MHCCSEFSLLLLLVFQPSEYSQSTDSSHSTVHQLEEMECLSDVVLPSEKSGSVEFPILRYSSEGNQIMFLLYRFLELLSAMPIIRLYKTKKFKIYDITELAYF